MIRNVQEILESIYRIFGSSILYSFSFVPSFYVLRTLTSATAGGIVSILTDMKHAEIGATAKMTEEEEPIHLHR